MNMRGKARLVTWAAGIVLLGCSSSSENGGGGSGGAGAGTTSHTSTGGSGLGGAGTGGAGHGATGGTGGTVSTGGNGTGGAGATGGSGGSAPGAVFVIVMENKAWCEIDGNNSDAPYINGTLLGLGAFASEYHGPLSGNLHPSEPNYIWMEAGDNLGIIDDNDPGQNHQSTTDHLVTQLEAAGVSWRSYQEDITGTVCPLTSSGGYRPKHNPMVFFDDVTNGNDPNDASCIAHNRPLTELDADLTNGTVARYNFITPNLCHDMHDACQPTNNRIRQGDDWLAQWVPKLRAAPQFQNNGTIFVTFDEAETTLPNGFCCILGNCPIGLIALSPRAKVGYVNSTSYDHSSLLKSLQIMFGVGPFIRHAGDPGTVDLGDLFTSFP